MLAVRAPAAQIEARLSEPLALAASNGPALCVVAGPHEAVRGFCQAPGRGAHCQPRSADVSRLPLSMMEPVVARLAAFVRKLTCRRLRFPLSPASPETGSRRSKHSFDYWARHLRGAGALR